MDSYFGGSARTFEALQFIWRLSRDTMVRKYDFKKHFNMYWVLSAFGAEAMSPYLKGT